MGEEMRYEIDVEVVMGALVSKINSLESEIKSKQAGSDKYFTFYCAISDWFGQNRQGGIADFLGVMRDRGDITQDDVNSFINFHKDTYEIN